VSHATATGREPDGHSAPGRVPTGIQERQPAVFANGSVTPEVALGWAMT
jgi:hypothetical protein